MNVRLFGLLIMIPGILAAQTSPVVTQRDRGETKIVLSRFIRKAVHKFDSTFIPLSGKDFTKKLREKKYRDRSSYLSFCTGDFDGNKLTDAVLIGRSSGGMRMIMAFQRQKNIFTVVKIKDFLFFDPGEVDTFLTKVPACALNVTAENRTISFDTDAFLLTYYRRGSFLYHWNGKEFDQHQLGD